MQKAYAIIRDDFDILVGSGGKVGIHPAARNGLHLPGGGRRPGESALTCTLREIAEETGIKLSAEDRLAEFTLTLNDCQVTFVVFEVADLASLIDQRKRPPITNVHDEPFAKVKPLPITNCAANKGFSAFNGTDWFAAGLKHARAICRL